MARDTERRSVTASSTRSNEYFVPKDGIDREVITADICRYLGNDALVRPGSYENPATRQVQQGYYITAYRNLTTAMIADLKADSQRWDQERRAATSRGNVGYTQSRTHESRQHWGPTVEATPTYTSSASAQSSYGHGDQYSQPSYAQPATGGYLQPAHTFMQPDNHYIAGSNMAIEQSRGYAPSAGVEVPRSNMPSYQQVSTSPQYSVPSADPYYGRGQPASVNVRSKRREEPSFSAPVGAPSSAYPDERTAYYSQSGPASMYGNGYDSRDYGERAYQDTSSYSSATLATSGSSVAPSQSRREREREPDVRESRSHREHGHGRRR